MKKLILAGLAVACLGLWSMHAWGHGHCCQPMPPAVKYVDKVITAYKPEWHTKEVPTTIFRKHHRIIEVPCTYTVMVPKPVLEKQKEVWYKSVPRPVCFDVPKTKSVPVEYKDPCTGCVKIKYETVCYMEKVCSTVTDVVPELRECLVEVNHFIPQEHDYTARRHITVDHPEVIMHTVRYCVMVPYEKTIKVPVCEPACPIPGVATPDEIGR